MIYMRRVPTQVAKQLKTWDLRNSEISAKSQNFMELWPSAWSSSQNEFFSKLAKYS